MKSPVLALFLCIPACVPAMLSAQSRQSFDSPEQAAQAAIHAAESGDNTALTAIFGPGARGILSSGDAKQDRQEQAEFAKLALSKHQIQKDPMNLNRVILSVGSQDWPFPIPIVRANGKWSFDATQGTLEMKARVIGSNELDAMEICAGYVTAQQEYATRVRDKHGMLEYAQHLSGPSESLGDLVPQAFANAEAGPKAKPYHGYFFRVLTAQGMNAPGGAHNFAVKDSMIGGFALLATPARYGVTGVHSFIVNQAGVIFEKDLGATPARIAAFDPDKTWVRVD
jgi:hypothetical protein